MKSVVFALLALMPAISYAQVCSTCGPQQVQYVQPAQQQVQYVQSAPAPSVSYAGLYAYPGDETITVNGVVINVKVSAQQPVQQSVQQVYRQPVQPQSSGGDYPYTIGEGTAAFAFAQQEANYLASRGVRDYESGVARFGAKHGHPMGVAPGARSAGTGYSWNMRHPQHCSDHEPPSNIVARARAQSADGAWFWSAHFR